MAVLLHVIVALSSMVFSSFLFFFPTKARLLASYVLVSITLVSGVYLTVMKPAHILTTCIMGLVYVGVVSVLIVSARSKMTAQVKRNHED